VKPIGLRLFPYLFGLWALATPLPAQYHAQLPGREVFIFNSGDKDIAFGLSCDDRGGWRASQLAAGKGARFECDDADAIMWIHINTDLPGKPHKEIERRLQNRGRYELFWDEDQGEWDIRLI